MTTIVLDLETTVQRLDDGIKDNSPFHPKNRIVSAHWSMVDEGEIGSIKSLIFHHNECLIPGSPEALQAALDQADTLVAHNAKYDVMYLLEAGFRIPETIYCTMIGEYILARGQGLPYSLEATAERRRVTLKKSDLIKDLFNSGIGFEAIPWATVLEYAEADVQSCAEIYLNQLADYADAKNKGLVPVRKAMNEMLLFLTEIERNGVKIDLDALEEVEVQFLDERDEIHARLKAVIVEVMGDTPINLNSGADLSMVVYSRRVKDRNTHVMKFNIGTDHRGKPLYPPRMKPAEFARAVRETTMIVNRTLAQHCTPCSGRGKFHRVKKDGALFKIPSKCGNCFGRGFTLLDTGVVAGLKLIPSGPQDASALGFTTDKATIKLLINQAEAKGNLQAMQFLKDVSRLNAVNTYLDSFVKGIQTWTRPDSILHPNFNQTTAKTGRLSSTKPNFQNQPKGGKFPVRKAVVSRFENGIIVEADFSGLEFAVAGDLSRDNQILTDIATGKDVHKQTASIVNQCEVSEVNKEMRQNAKAYTFAPLYGGQGANEPQHVRVYFREFFNIYKGLGIYHKKLTDGVLKDGIVRIPSGREYLFTGVRRYPNGRVSNQTAIVNYPVQGFATGDIVPLACVRTMNRFRELNLRSKLILTVHDSIVVDCHPEELEQVKSALKWAMCHVPDEVFERYGYRMAFEKLNIEISVGENWLSMEEIT